MSRARRTRWIVLVGGLAAVLAAGASVAFAAGAFGQERSTSGTSPTRSAAGESATPDCWALLERDKDKLPAAAQTALAVASADPNSHSGCMIFVRP